MLLGALDPPALVRVLPLAAGAHARAATGSATLRERESGVAATRAAARMIADMRYI